MSIEAQISSGVVTNLGFEGEPVNVGQNEDQIFSKPSTVINVRPERTTPLMEEVLSRSGSLVTIKELLQEELVEKGITLREAETKFEVADSTVHAWKEALEIKGRDILSPKKNTKVIRKLRIHGYDGESPEQTLERLYSTRSLRSVAGLLKVSHDAVRGALIKFGINRHEPHNYNINS